MKRPKSLVRASSPSTLVRQRLTLAAPDRALRNPHRSCSRGSYCGRACRRIRLAVAVLHEIAHQPPTQAWPIAWLLIRVTWLLLLIHVAEITVWALFYSVGGMPARCRVGVLLFRSHLCDDWLRGSGVAEALADAWPGRGLDRHSHVRIVRRPFLRLSEQDLHVTFRTKAKMRP